MITDLHDAPQEVLRQAAAMLVDVFTPLGSDAWRTEEEGLQEVHECCRPGNICIALWDRETLAGWGGARPMYKQITWELHPLVISPGLQGKGLGRVLLAAVEEEVRRRGGQALLLGSDDENGRTNLNELDPARQPLESVLSALRSHGGHPYEFYRRQGYRIVGIIPDASGPGTHDIWMWKSLRP